MPKSLPGTLTSPVNRARGGQEQGVSLRIASVRQVTRPPVTCQRGQRHTLSPVPTMVAVITEPNATGCGAHIPPTANARHPLSATIREPRRVSEVTVARLRDAHHDLRPIAEVARGRSRAFAVNRTDASRLLGRRRRPPRAAHRPAPACKVAAVLGAVSPSTSASRHGFWLNLGATFAPAGVRESRAWFAAAPCRTETAPPFSPRMARLATVFAR